MQAIAVTACISIADYRPLARTYSISPDRQGRESRQACRLNASARTRRSKIWQRDATRVSEKGIVLNFMKDCIAPKLFSRPWVQSHDNHRLVRPAPLGRQSSYFAADKKKLELGQG